MKLLRKIELIVEAVDREAVLRFWYIDLEQMISQRFVSPIRIEGGCLLAMCLHREEPRQFDLSRVHMMSICAAHEFTIPLDPLVKMPLDDALAAVKELSN